MGKNLLATVVEALVIIGGLNWGLVGIANLNVIELLFSSVPVLVTIIYLLVGLSALYMLVAVFSKK
jgi:uncharacterized membrane protein YuzA (DUF378 family)